MCIANRQLCVAGCRQAIANPRSAHSNGSVTAGQPASRSGCAKTGVSRTGVSRIPQNGESEWGSYYLIRAMTPYPLTPLGGCVVDFGGKQEPPLQKKKREEFPIGNSQFGTKLVIIVVKN